MFKSYGSSERDVFTFSASTLAYVEGHITPAFFLCRVKTKKRSLPLVSNNDSDEASVQETPLLSSNESKIFNVSYSKSNGRLSPRSLSEGIDHSYSPPDLGSQLDANSAAAASVAALTIAIEKAQARIQAAKQIKRKEGF
ncbi:hypothetical protein MLD38_000770 [Melastoma candidum]|uniref:Uncharacterized protein n=1 Tax=Melastoma candidum TaxID=119954 RepID=A0ACB9SEH4_9MYRT|nr:hypothetical protein MLD38_000770 [Melastoma candidum]